MSNSPRTFDGDAKSLQNILRCPGEIIKLNNTDPLYRIWEAIRKGQPKYIFSTRDGVQVLDIGGRGYSAIHIRNEYERAWRDASLLYTKGVQFFETPPDNEDVDEDGTSSEILEEQIAVHAGTYIAEEHTPMPVWTHINEARAGCQLKPRNRTPSDARGWVDHAVAMIVTGHSGIGKSVWLEYALVKRLETGEPVILQTNAESIHLFNEHGVFLIPMLGFHEYAVKQLRLCIPTTTWFFVDSNQNIKSPTLILAEMGLFIIEAASPQKERYDWTDKEQYLSMMWIMKPPTLEEIRDEWPSAYGSARSQYIAQYPPREPWSISSRYSGQHHHRIRLPTPAAQLRIGVTGYCYKLFVAERGSRALAAVFSS